MPNFHALCIGISDYSGVAKIPSAEVEAAKVCRNLQARGVRTTLITGARATLERLKGEFERLRKECAPGDHLIVYFSGHGGQNAQLPVEEDRSSPEYLVLYDAQLLDSALEDELGSLPEVNVLLLLDACHAAGMSPNLEALADRMSGAHTEGRFIQTIAAAREGDLAAGTVTNGNMSRALLDVLGRAELPKTYAEFFQAIKDKMPATPVPVHRSVPQNAAEEAMVLGGKPPGLERNRHQAHVLHGFSAHLHQALFFFHIEDGASFKAEMRAAKFWPTSAGEYSTEQRVARAVAFSFAGLFMLGAKDLIQVGERSRELGQALIEELERIKMPAEYTRHPLADRPSFEVGMAYRSLQVLHDPWVGKGSSSEWKIPGDSAVHGVFLLAGLDEAELRAEVDKLKHLAGIGRTGEVQWGQVRERDHFGLRDGIAVPGVAAVEGDALKIIPEAATSVHAADMLLLRGNIPTWANDGSFLVYRRLNQDKVMAQKLVGELASKLDVTPEAASCMLIGRRPDGTSLEVPAAAEGTTEQVQPAVLDDFDYGAQKKCPAFAHARKANPRLAGVPTPPLFRRGIFFESDGTEPDGGLHFMCYQASIEGHFELITAWMNHPDLPEKDGGLDVLMGRHAGTRWQAPRSIPGAENISECVYPSGGEYLFAPTLDGLRELVGA